MNNKKREHPAEKTVLHCRNKHRERYDFSALIATCEALAPFVKVNEYNDETIDFFHPEAVKTLNKALLMHYYGIGYWDIPAGYLCPPIPGRADYLHYAADILGRSNHNTIPTGTAIRCLDIGVGANCVYPIIGTSEYGWSFVGSDIDKEAIDSALAIIDANSVLKGKIELRYQPSPSDLFKGIIRPGEHFDLTICNPPFHASREEAQQGTLRKLSNLKGKLTTNPKLNFGGRSNELWCEGGEERFVRNMIIQSREFASSVNWFTTLISKKNNLESAYRNLKKVGAVEVNTLPMGQGNKVSRMVAWRF
jgi:23S rRNA (adenine1618-N6)-methyltransferase